jgi:hypothetical protein
MCPTAATSNTLNLGIPDGRLQDATIDLFARGDWKISPGSNVAKDAITLANAESLLASVQAVKVRQ